MGLLPADCGLATDERVAASVAGVAVDDITDVGGALSDAARPVEAVDEWKSLGESATAEPGNAEWLRRGAY